MKVLVAGGAGYIGSVMVRHLLKAGHRVSVLDNLSTGNRAAVPRRAVFYKADLRNAAAVRSVLRRAKPDAVMHFAASSQVGESVEKPLLYFENNVGACLALLAEMRRAGVDLLVFSSTSAVYGEPKRLPIRETDAIDPKNPYGRSKRMIEEILLTLAGAGQLRFVALRYFNAAGAMKDGSCGEMHEPESHLIPNILKTLTGEKKEFLQFGDDYPTPDGSCIRDYVHVEDLAEAHLAALSALAKGKLHHDIFNLGSAHGHSIREVLRAAERVAGRKVPVRIRPRRPGDPARLVASAAKARKILRWKPTRDLNAILETAWNWELSRRRKKR